MPGPRNPYSADLTYAIPGDPYAVPTPPSRQEVTPKMPKVPPPELSNRERKVLREAMNTLAGKPFLKDVYDTLRDWIRRNGNPSPPKSIDIETNRGIVEADLYLKLETYPRLGSNMPNGITLKVFDKAGNDKGNLLWIEHNEDGEICFIRSEGCHSSIGINLDARGRVKIEE